MQSIENDDPTVFSRHLRHGIPLVIDGAGLRMSRRYDAAYFAHALRGRKVTTIDCETGDPREELAEDFFGAFGSPDNEELRKIKVSLVVHNLECMVPDPSCVLGLSSRR